MTREQMIQTLQVNCACVQDGAALNQLSTEMLAKLIANEPKAQGSNAGRKPDTTTAARQPKKEKQEDGAYVGGGGGPTMREDPIADDDEDEGKCDEDKGFTGNRRTSVNMQQWLEAMPAEARPVWNSMVEASDREHKMLVNRLTTHISDPQVKTRKTAQLMKKDRQDLLDMIDLLPAPSFNSQAAELPLPSYFGAATPMGAGMGTSQLTENFGEDKDQEDILPIPTINWQELAEEHRQRKQA